MTWIVIAFVAYVAGMLIERRSFRRCQPRSSQRYAALTATAALYMTGVASSAMWMIGVESVGVGFRSVAVATMAVAFVTLGYNLWRSARRIRGHAA